MLQLGYLWLLITIFFWWKNVVVIEGRQVYNTTFDCGNIKNFTYPFWLINTTVVNLKERHSGYPDFGINCSTGNPILALSDTLFYVTSINFTQQSLTVVDLDFMGKTCPRIHRNYDIYPNFYWASVNRVVKYYCNCNMYNLYPPPLSVPYISCLGSNTSNRPYVFESDAVPNFNWDKNCEVRFQIPVLFKAPNVSKYGSILQLGFFMGWRTPLECVSCKDSGGKCGFSPSGNNFLCYCLGNTTVDNCNDYQVAGSSNHTRTCSNHTRTKVIIIGVSGVGTLVLIILLVYILGCKRRMYSLCCQICKWNNQSRKNTNVEVFLKNYGRLAPYRYRYSELKRITNFFKDKLGQGGYGGVFKGKLKDGRLVAVKVLIESKGNGEEFINEVATIGNTNHVNIVSLLGYCSQGPKRALVYEFMPNGSLEKFIYNDKSTTTKNLLGWEKLYQIALGIANGLEYLHRGCNTRILHFDIKPHNILLDKDFCPKISDFGLAKLCPTRDSIVSMLGTRGTIGYIAPEVYYRNFGGVSSKSDVYSFGMMMLEMVGGRKNIDATAENTSEIYFPQWIYNHLEQHGSIGLGGFREMFEEEGIKKMTIVGLWCIQTHPADRPSMSMVVEMLKKVSMTCKYRPTLFKTVNLLSLLHNPLCSTRSTSTSHM